MPLKGRPPWLLFWRTSWLLTFLSHLDPFSPPICQHVIPVLHTLLPLTPSAIICSNFFNNHLYTNDTQMYEFVLSFLLSFLEEMFPNLFSFSQDLCLQCLILLMPLPCSEWIKLQALNFFFFIHNHLSYFTNSSSKGFPNCLLSFHACCTTGTPGFSNSGLVFKLFSKPVASPSLDHPLTGQDSLRLRNLWCLPKYRV